MVALLKKGRDESPSFLWNDCMVTRNDCSKSKEIQEYFVWPGLYVAQFIGEWLNEEMYNLISKSQLGSRYHSAEPESGQGYFFLRSWNWGVVIILSNPNPASISVNWFLLIISVNVFTHHLIHKTWRPE